MGVGFMGQAYRMPISSSDTNGVSGCGGGNNASDNDILMIVVMIMSITMVVITIRWWWWWQWQVVFVVVSMVASIATKNIIAKCDKYVFILKLKTNFTKYFFMILKMNEKYFKNNLKIISVPFLLNIFCFKNYIWNLKTENSQLSKQIFEKIYIFLIFIKI